MNTQLLIDDTHELFSHDGMHYIVFPSEYQHIRYFTLMLVQHSRPKSDERLLLEQQVSEIIKNAVKHGNGCNTSKDVKIWYRFTATEARLIVEDAGSGFKDIEKWNAFNQKREEFLNNEDFIGLMDFVSWRTKKSDQYDGGNALFAALEYWDRGVVYTEKRNTIAVGKKFATDFMEMEGDE